MTVLAVRSAGLAFYRPALQAVIPLIVPRHELTRYAGFTQSFKSMSLLASPALAAALYPIWGLDNIVLLDVAGALLAVSAFAVVHIASPPRDTGGKKTSVLGEVADGFRLMKKDATLMSVMIIGAVYSVIYSTIGTLFPHITMVYFGGGVAQSSMVEIVFAVGMLAGSLLLGMVGGRLNHMRAISFSIAAYGAGTLLTGLQPPQGFLFFVIFSFFMGIANPFFMGVQVAVFQLRVREDYLGRVLSLNNSAAMLARPLGLSLSGLFADKMGINIWFVTAGAGALLLAFASLMLPAMRHAETEPVS
jgi:DHA3 family macrolide efflux protein-like MFS transporter